MKKKILFVGIVTGETEDQQHYFVHFGGPNGLTAVPRTAVSKQSKINRKQKAEVAASVQMSEHSDHSI